MVLSRQESATELRIGGQWIEGLVHTVRQFTGGSRHDSAVFELLGNASQNIPLFEDGEYHSAVLTNQICEVFRTDRAGAQRRIHYGRVVAVNHRWSPTGEVLTITSRFDSHLFKLGDSGAQMNEEFTFDHRNDADFDGDAVFLSVAPSSFPVVFNPAVKGKQLPNMVAASIDDIPDFFADPSSYPRTGALPTSPASVLFWTLSHCVYFLLNEMNESQTHAMNPTWAQIKNQLGIDENLIRNVAIPYGAKLPESLDKVLSPFGWVWYLDYENTGKPLIRFSRRDYTAINVLHIQSHGEDLNESTEVKSFELSYDIVNQNATKIVVAMEAPVVESTWELLPAWDPQYDAIDPSTLWYNSDDIVATSPKSRVWRDWVLNEGRDYDGLRDDHRAVEDYDIKKQFENRFIDATNEPVVDHVEVLNSRKKFGPPLTVFDEGSPAGTNSSRAVVEFKWDTQDWVDISTISTSAQFSLLEDECGIRFTGNGKPPLDFIGAYDEFGASEWWKKFRIRVTATVQSDRWLTMEATANGHAIHKIARLADRSKSYKYRTVSYQSKFFQDILQGNLKANEVDDSIAAKLWAESVVDHWRGATLDGAIVLEGIDNTQEPPFLGRVIERITGKQIRFNLTKDGTKQYPMVVGVIYNVQEQETRLQLETFRRG